MPRVGAGATDQQTDRNGLFITHDLFSFNGSRRLRVGRPDTYATYRRSNLHYLPPPSQLSRKPNRLVARRVGSFKLC